jgi:hypothetical protein
LNLAGASNKLGSPTFVASLTGIPRKRVAPRSEGLCGVENRTGASPLANRTCESPTAADSDLTTAGWADATADADSPAGPAGAQGVAERCPSPVGGVADGCADF